MLPLLHGELLNAAQKAEFEATITHHTMLHDQFTQFFRGFRRDAHPMAIGRLRRCAFAFYHDHLDVNSPEDRLISAHRLIAKIPTLAAMAYKYSVGQPFQYPDNSLSYAGNFLQMTLACQLRNTK